MISAPLSGASWSASDNALARAATRAVSIAFNTAGVQRPSNENTNGSLRQYLPKGTDLSGWTADQLHFIEAMQRWARHQRPPMIRDVH
ncbi:MAG: transposase, family protein [Propionibacteriaceae bacterium]|jgi:hypothetical protein|nr:transposase, family protein [Propionibacteriaceae bacterium]